MLSYFCLPSYSQNLGAPAERRHGHTEAEVVAQGQSLRPVQLSADAAAQQRPGHPQLCWRFLRPGSWCGAVLPHRHGGELVVSEEGL